MFIVYIDPCLGRFYYFFNCISKGLQLLLAYLNSGVSQSSCKSLHSQTAVAANIIWLEACVRGINAGKEKEFEEFQSESESSSNP